MFLKSIYLQNFRNYKKSEFNFNQGTTLIVGPNTAGKTNLIEAIFFLSTGKSFKGADADVILFGEDVARIKANNLEIVFSNQEGRFFKKYLVNGVSKQRVNFVGNLPSVLFAPTDLDLVIASPSKRRNYLDFVLEQVDANYRRSLLLYEKALRARNRLLENAKKFGKKDDKLFDYWDEALIVNGNIITQTRESFISYINNFGKKVFDFYNIYDKSLISESRFLQYEDAELASGVTLVGPHRDDFSMLMHANKDIKFFGSRGEQRLTVLQLKIIELSFLKEKLEEVPLLLLDDIFSELDSQHIRLVLSMIAGQQTIITTTHKEFIPKNILEKIQAIELGIKT